MKYTAIILAAGSGIRTGLDYNKIFHKINGKRVLDYSIEFFKNSTRCEEIILVCSDDDFNFVYNEYSSDVDRIIPGGKNRQNSVYNGLQKVNSEYVLIHDSARPFISEEKIDLLCDDVIFTKATTLAVFVKDTIVRINGNRLGSTIDRSTLLAVQTPQAFDTKLIINAHEKAKMVGFIATDDTDLVAKFTNVMPSYVIGDYRSVKLTTIEDIPYLEVIL
jgi:2-C-methyl-D-erythritol 4-phosphate cytidylyltransferase